MERFCIHALHLGHHCVSVRYTDQVRVTGPVSVSRHLRPFFSQVVKGGRPYTRPSLAGADTANEGFDTRSMIFRGPLGSEKVIPFA